MTLANPFIAVQEAARPAARRRRYDWEAYLYLLPAFLILALFHILPVLNALYISLHTWGVAPVPHTTPKPVVDVYGPSVTIFNNSPEKAQAAWRFVKYLMSPDANAKWVQATAYFPARKSTLDQLKDYISKNALYGTLVDNLQYGHTEPQIAAWTPVRGSLADAITGVASGASTPEDAIKTAVDKATAALAK